MIKNLLKLEIRDMGEAAEVINHRIKNYELLVIPSLRLTIEYIKQYKNISAKRHQINFSIFLRREITNHCMVFLYDSAFKRLSISDLFSISNSTSHPSS